MDKLVQDWIRTIVMDNGNGELKIGEWVIECLCDTQCRGSDEVLKFIINKRKDTIPLN